MNKDRDYKDLDEMAQKEGVIAVLNFLAYNPTCIQYAKNEPMVYRHTRMPVVPFKVERSYDLEQFLKLNDTKR